MRFVSLFSGIEAASVAWEPLGWEAMAFCEIEPFPCAVLEHRFPSVPNLGDVSLVDWKEFVNERGRPDVVVGGSPCQAFSVAGKRLGIDDPRGRLMLEFVRAVRELGPRWVLWENVPGVLSQDEGRAFGTLLGELEDCGLSLAWRVLDAQFFGVAQRRRRVFLVANSGTGGGAAQVLVERGCMFGDSLASKEKRQELAEAAGIDARCAGFKFHQGAGAGGIGCEVEVSPTLTADWHQPAVYGLSGNVIGREEANGGNQTGYCDPDENGYYTLTATDRHGIVCIADDAANAAVDIDLCGTLKCGGSPPTVALEAGARRLTPRECERLQGFPDDWTLVPYRGRPASECPDGPRYKAVGNSMAVPVMRWIGERIARVEGETE